MLKRKRPVNCLRGKFCFFLSLFWELSGVWAVRAERFDGVSCLVLKNASGGDRGGGVGRFTKGLTVDSDERDVPVCSFQVI